MLDLARFTAVGQLVRRVVDEVVMTRFRRLDAASVAEKAPGDLVTVADTLTEQRLTEELVRLLPGSTAVGEEAVARDPAVLAALGGPAPVWIIDPVDGTAGFVAGGTRFSTMVALSVAGRTVASWVYAPVSGTMATASAGSAGGAWLDGRPVTVPAGAGWPGLRVVNTDPRYHTPVDQLVVDRLAGLGATVVPCDGIGHSYLDLVTGRADALAVSWEKPWDHAAGLFLYERAGGCAGAADGTPYRVTGGNALPLLAAADRPTFDQLCGLFTAGAPETGGR
ncbi:inositol monophosphatase family protein [Micromonospora sp. NPDC023956]|uniref:inositol monophosphatase family protein n=1 Tax=Micromonospora sp. NPDC023956 TaxID=3155722 RepID=UPI0033F1DCB6